MDDFRRENVHENRPRFLVLNINLKFIINIKYLGWVRGIEPPTPRVTVWDTPKTDAVENTALT
jgi:hypothetical protein